MKLFGKLTKTLLAAATLALPFTGTATAADYPSKDIMHIMPWSAGGGTDTVMRTFMNFAEKQLEVGINTQNVTGAQSGVGTLRLMKSRPDGYTIGSFVIGVPVVGHQIGIDELTPEKFDPMGIFLTYPFVIATSKDAPYSNMDELAAYAKENDVALGHFGDPLTPTQVTKAMPKRYAPRSSMTSRPPPMISVRFSPRARNIERTQ